MTVKEFAELIKKEDIDQLSKSENLNFDNDRIGILESMQSIDVQACPGSGKTTLIAAKLMLLAKKWPLPDRGICVLSHTNVAKDEIIDRLKKSNTLEAERLLSYPHFIGTIQEFTNRFLALPSIHSRGIDEVIVDNDEYATLASKILSGKQFSWLSGTLNGLGGDDMKMAFLRNTYLLPSGEVNISKKPRAWSQKSNLDKAKRLLKILKNYLDNRGYYLYRDMYSQAQKICVENDKLCKALSKRFPYVLIDEMQDTQEFQDDLLCKIFPLDESNITVQRFGDPDQSIFHGISNEESNKSFNKKQADDMNFVVNKSHRFDAALAAKIKPLSVNQISLSTELTNEQKESRLKASSQPGGFQHNVIIYDNETIDKVIESFGNIVSEQFHIEYKISPNFTVKALGAVGNEIDPNQEQLKIGHYWEPYDKNKTSSSSKATSLIDLARRARHSSTPDWNENYKILIDGIIKWLSLSRKFDQNDRRFTHQTLKQFLQDEEQWIPFRTIIYSLLTEKGPIQKDVWQKTCSKLRDVFELKSSLFTAKKFIQYSKQSATHDESNIPHSENLKPLPENIIRYADEFDIHLSTIHAVKGETHDATLILETKNRSYDINTLIDYISEHNQSKITQKTKLKFSRQLYVAASRPRHLLCIAIHQDRITEEHKVSLRNLGWNIHPISTGANTDDS